MMKRFTYQRISGFGTAVKRYRACRAVATACLLVLTAGCGHFGGPPPAAASSDSALTAIIDFYQGPLDHLAPVRQGVCPMYPSCSEYSREVIEKYGFLKGWMMTCDRLIRCGRDELSHSRQVRVDGKIRCYDPPENNELGAGPAKDRPVRPPAPHDDAGWNPDISMPNREG